MTPSAGSPKRRPNPAKVFGLWVGQQLLTTYVLGSLSAIVPPAAFALLGWDFISSGHVIPGWAILAMSAAVGLLVFSAGLNIVQWRRQKQQPSLAVVPHGGDHAFFWNLMPGANNPEPMAVSGLFELTNLTDYHVRVPRTILEISYRCLYIIPARHRLEGSALPEHIPSHTVDTARLNWFGGPVMECGKMFRGRVVLIDNRGRPNRSGWIRWPYRA